MEDGRRKILAGAQIRKLRADLGLSQTAMASELGISVSYLNLVERNQRPLTAQLLIRLSETYAIDAHAFARDPEAQSAAELGEILADPVLRPLGVPRAEIRAALEQTPTLVHALKRLHGAYMALSELGPSALGPGAERGEAETRAGDAVERVRSLLEASANHFPALEGAAEAIELDTGDGLFAAAARRLHDRHRIRVAVLPAAEMGVTLRHYDRHRRRLMISELVEPPGRVFQLAYQIALLEAGPAIDAALDGAGLVDHHVRRLGRVTLANYVAAAQMMPYAPFLGAAQALGYDVELLAARFGASWEQVAHRLTTLARPSARGVPFFMVRVDLAGNVSKRFSSGAFPFSRLGGTCPRWTLHAAFASPGRTLVQVIELDGKQWLSIARAVRRTARPWGDPDTPFAVGLGCELRHAPQLVYGRSLRDALPTEIGINCRLCERPSCLSRAAPSLKTGLDVVETTRGFSPFGN